MAHAIYLLLLPLGYLGVIWIYSHICLGLVCILDVHLSVTIVVLRSCIESPYLAYTAFLAVSGNLIYTIQLRSCTNQHVSLLLLFISASGLNVESQLICLHHTVI